MPSKQKNRHEKRRKKVKQINSKIGLVAGRSGICRKVFPKIHNLIRQVLNVVEIQLRGSSVAALLVLFAREMQINVTRGAQASIKLFIYFIFAVHLFRFFFVSLSFNIFDLSTQCDSFPIPWKCCFSSFEYNSVCRHIGSSLPITRWETANSSEMYCNRSKFSFAGSRAIKRAI